MIDREGYQVIAKKTRELFDSYSPEEIALDPYRIIFRTTSGTTRAAEPLLVAQQIQDEAFRRGEGMNRILIALGRRHTLLANIIFSVHRAEPAQAMVIDVTDLEPAHLEAMHSFGADGILGFPSFVVRMLSTFSEEARGRIRHLFLTGERVSPLHLEVFAKLIPQATMTTGYIVTEFGAIGYRCSYLDLNSYHPVEGVRVRCLNPDETGRGVALVSRVIAGAIPVTDYNTGDEIRIVSAPCLCGAQESFQFLGRLGFDHVSVAGGLISVDELDRIAMLLGLRLDEYVLEAGVVPHETKGVQGALHLKIREQALDLAAEDIVRFVHEQFRVTSRTLGDLVAAGDFAPLRVSFVPSPHEPGRKSLRLIKRDML